MEQILKIVHANIRGMVTSGRENIKCRGLRRNMHGARQEQQAGKDGWSATGEGEEAGDLRSEGQSGAGHTETG